MKESLLQIFMLTILLTSCVSEKEQNAASKAATILNAESC
jgi:nitrous oxide reductase accessory protein NosL